MMNNEYLLDIILYSNKNNKNININNELERIKNICIIYEENKYKCIDNNKSIHNNYIPSDTVIYKKNKVKNNVVSEETEIKIKNHECKCDIEKELCMPPNIKECKYFNKFIELNPIYNLIYKKEKYTIVYKCNHIQEYNKEVKNIIMINIKQHLDIVAASLYEYKVIAVISLYYFLLKNYNFLEESKTFFDVSLKKLHEINADNKKYTSIFKNYYLDEDILDKFIVLFENPIFV